MEATHTELAGCRERMDTRKDPEILDERIFFFFGIEFHEENESKKEELKGRSQLHINTRLLNIYRSIR